MYWTRNKISTGIQKQTEVFILVRIINVVIILMDLELKQAYILTKVEK